MVELLGEGVMEKKRCTTLCHLERSAVDDASICCVVHWLCRSLVCGCVLCLDDTIARRKGEVENNANEKSQSESLLAMGR